MPFRDRFPPGLITIVVAYVLALGVLGVVQYFDLGDRQDASGLTFIVLVVGAVYIARCLHPEWDVWTDD